jgi:glycosyltransferase involved in cell wall biosynthesis
VTVARRLGILFAALGSPFPPTNGHRLRTWALLRALAEDGHRVALVTFATEEERRGGWAELGRLCETVEMVEAPPEGGRHFARVFALGSRLPFGAWRFRSPALAARLRRHLEAGGIDLIVCDGVYNAQNLPTAPGVPVVLNKDDVAHVILRRYLDLERHPVRRFYGELECRKVRRWERLVCRRMSAVLVCSAHDGLILRALCPGVPMPVIPNAVDTDHYQPRSGDVAHTVLFQGGMDWHPNRDAVEFFAARILPDLRRRVPDVIFRVAGRSPSAAFRRRFAQVEGLQFSDTVPDMRQEIARASVCVVPLRIGSGTRLKILEAAAMAKPIVSTRLGAEGLDLVAHEEILLEDDPRRFAEVVAGVLGDLLRQRALGSAARQRIVRQYSLPVFRAAVREAVATVHDASTSPARPRLMAARSSGA